MKKIFPFLMALLLIASCGEDDENDIQNICSFCNKEYSGTFNSDLTLDGIQFNESNKTYSIKFGDIEDNNLCPTDINFTLFAPFAARPRELNLISQLSGNALTFTSQIFADPIQVGNNEIEMGVFTLNGTLTFDESFINYTGTFNVTGRGTGTITFTGTR